MINLRDKVNEVMGHHKCVFHRQYFTASVADIFVVAQNTTTDTYELFYEEDGRLYSYSIGSKIALKQFICKAYKLALSGTYDNQFWYSLKQKEHIKAQARAHSFIHADQSLTQAS